MLMSRRPSGQVEAVVAVALASEHRSHQWGKLAVQLTYIERLAVRLLIRSKLSELHENAFEQFFHELMCVKYDDYINVKTAGSLGDLGSDGLRLYERNLYACYGPEVFDADRVAAKFDSDLEKAIRKRGGQFDTFTFVHNDLRGVHPIVSQAMSAAATQYPELKFAAFGLTRFREELVQLTRAQVEDLLGSELPVQELQYKMPLDEVMPLLAHLCLNTADRHHRRSRSNSVSRQT